MREIEDQYTEGLITDGERYNKVVDIWAQVAERVAEEMMNEISTEEVSDPGGRSKRMPSFNAIYIMADSGARGSAQQIRQLAGYARSDGQAVGRDHRDADHDQLPRRPVGVAVLHLDARRAQGSGGYGVEDGELWAT